MKQLSLPFNKEVIAPGIDVYDKVTYVIYDLSRPPYWVLATVEEAFAIARKEVKKEKDEITAKYLNEYLEKEWADISPANLKNQAYFGGGITRVSDVSGLGGEKNLFPPIVKVNPEYWNKKLPKSAIQFLIFWRLADTKRYTTQKEEYLKHNSQSYHLQRFLEALDINMFPELIDK